MAKKNIIYLISEKHRHNSVKDEYLTLKKINVDGKNIDVMYCSICNIFMCPQKMYDSKLKGIIQSKNFKSLKKNDYIVDSCFNTNEIYDYSVNKSENLKYEHINHNLSRIKINYKNTELDVLCCDQCKAIGVNDDYYEKILTNKKIIKHPNNSKKIKIDKFDVRKNSKTNHLHHIIENKKIYLDDFEIELKYCIDCRMYLANKELYERYIKENFICEFVDENSIINKIESNFLGKSIIEFLVRITNFRCNKNGHNIEEVNAVVNVFNKQNSKVSEVDIPAFYCRNCNIYYIYENEFKKLLSYGIPTCPVHEENKYFSEKGSFENYSSESLLRQFGYNVNAQENLSTNERHRILMMILDNGIMDKNLVMSHLHYLYSSRKNQVIMQNAVSKWKQDITFVSEYNIENNRKVKVGAFRVKK